MNPVIPAPRLKQLLTLKPTRLNISFRSGNQDLSLCSVVVDGDAFACIVEQAGEYPFSMHHVLRSLVARALPDRDRGLRG